MRAILFDQRARQSPTRSSEAHQGLCLACTFSIKKPPLGLYTLVMGRCQPFKIRYRSATG